MRLARFAAVLVVAAAMASVCRLPGGRDAAWAQGRSQGLGLVDARTGEVIASHAASKRLPIASTTKLMTA